MSGILFAIAFFIGLLVAGVLILEGLERLFGGSRSGPSPVSHHRYPVSYDMTCHPRNDDLVTCSSYDVRSHPVHQNEDGDWVSDEIKKEYEDGGL